MKYIEIVFLSFHDLQELITNIVDDNDEVIIIKVALQEIKRQNTMIQTIAHIAYNIPQSTEKCEWHERAQTEEQVQELMFLLVSDDHVIDDD